MLFAGDDVTPSFAHGSQPCDQLLAAKSGNGICADIAERRIRRGLVHAAEGRRNLEGIVEAEAVELVDEAESREVFQYQGGPERIINDAQTLRMPDVDAAEQRSIRRRLSFVCPRPSGRITVGSIVGQLDHDRGLATVEGDLHDLGEDASADPEYVHVIDRCVRNRGFHRRPGSLYGRWPHHWLLRFGRYWSHRFSVPSMNT